MGISQGVQPIIGYNFGAKQYERTREAILKAIAAGVAISLVAYVAMFTVPEQLVSIFNRNDASLAHLGARVLIISNLLLPGVAFGVIGSQYFQAVGKAKMAIDVYKRQSIPFEILIKTDNLKVWENILTTSEVIGLSTKLLREYHYLSLIHIWSGGWSQTARRRRALLCGWSLCCPSAGRFA